MKPNNSKPRAITDDEIAAAAYERYLRRGGEDGHDIEDWLAAEAELRNGVAGYDAAVRGAEPLDSEWDMEDAESESANAPASGPEERRLAATDGRAERDAIADVRRRESKGR